MTLTQVDMVIMILGCFFGGLFLFLLGMHFSKVQPSRLLKALKTFAFLELLGAACSMVPFHMIGLVLGFPAYTLNSLILTGLYMYETKGKDDK